MAATENRYHENGKIKPSLAKDNSMHLEDWQRVELESNTLAKEFLKQVSRTSALVSVLHQQAKRDYHNWSAVLYLK
ncbi:MAG: hypothetical protein JSS93_03505 [Bacteroidetes bacterium]|nr:hypothetical protein [Bacteroidota bacterium]